MALTEPVPGKTKQRKRKTPQQITESDDDLEKLISEKWWRGSGVRCLGCTGLL